MSSIAADDSAAAPTRLYLPKELTQWVELAGLVETKPIELFASLEKKKHVRINLDRERLEKVCKKSLKDLTVIVPSRSLPLGLGVELIANQMHGTLQESTSGWRVVPGPSKARDFLAPCSETTKKIYAAMTEIKAIEDSPASDIFDFFGEKYHLRIVIAPGPLDHAGGVISGSKLCRLPAGQKPVLDWIKDVAIQMGAEAVPFQDLILISRRGNRN